MLRGLLLLLFASANLAFSALPYPAAINAVQVDSSGYIYLAGEFYPNVPNSPIGHAFVGKFSQDGSQVIWWTALAGSSNDSVAAIALGSDDSVYVTGNTQSPDFPTTSGSMQPTASALIQTFAAKVNPSGTVVYATYIGGSAETSGVAIAVDSSGDAFITGLILEPSGIFPTSPGAVVGTTAANGTAYIIELNPAGSAAPVAISGYGGTAIAVDPQGNIYVAGSYANPVPTTPGAFQAGTAQAICAYEGFFGHIPCGYQHIVKIDPTGTRLIFATYLNGTYAAMPSAIAVNADGSIIVAGSTNSPDYPTTPTAYQPEYSANPAFTFEPVANEDPPAASGYITKLNASGSSLIWSTLLGGSSTNPALGDSISSMGFDSAGNILLAGRASSVDFPGLWATPVASRPTAGGEGFVARLSPDGTTLSPTELIPGSVNANAIAVRSDGSAIAVTYGSTFVSGIADYQLATVSLSTVGRVAAIADTADNAKIVSVAPGQLLTLYGTNLATANVTGIKVTFNGIAAPILYSSSIQINVQVPYEIAGQTQVTMQVASQLVTPPVAESYILAVVERQPSVFLSPSQPLFDMSACNGRIVSGLQPLALNADGTLNTCAHPAASGSTVTIFLNGLGATTPSQATGTVSSSLESVSPAATLVPGPQAAASVVSTATLPGSIDSVAQVQIQVSSTSAVSIPLEVQQPSESPFLVRGPGILIWVRQ